MGVEEEIRKEGQKQGSEEGKRSKPRKTENLSQWVGKGKCGYTNIAGTITRDARDNTGRRRQRIGGERGGEGRGEGNRRMRNRKIKPENFPEWFGNQQDTKMGLNDITGHKRTT